MIKIQPKSEVKAKAKAKVKVKNLSISTSSYYLLFLPPEDAPAPSVTGANRCNIL
jgi:hypothetical protein